MTQLLSFAQQVAYHQEQPLAINYQFAGKQYTYYPELLATTDGHCLLIEVKPVYETAIAINLRAVPQLLVVGEMAACPDR